MAGADAASDRPRRRRLARIGIWAGRILLLLILLPALALAVLVGRVWFGQPALDGRRAVPGLDAEATVARDAKGVVHIEAATERDAYVALGFVHAQDRFFQMDAMRRLTAGRLAEIVGPPALQFDVRMRTLGLGRLAEGDVAALSPEAAEVYRAYAEGVNAWLGLRQGVAADELALLLAPEPEPWRAADSLAWNRLMSLRLVGNWASELMRLRLARVLSPEQIADLWPSYPE
ncbi:MAG: penicillin acylase family protein, partial [Alphaproteobacteria bacterium]